MFLVLFFVTFLPDNFDTCVVLFFLSFFEDYYAWIPQILQASAKVLSPVGSGSGYPYFKAQSQRVGREPLPHVY